MYDVEKTEKITQQIPSTSEEVSEEIYRYEVSVPGNAFSYQENTQVFAIGSDQSDIIETLRCAWVLYHSLKFIPENSQWFL